MIERLREGNGVGVTTDVVAHTPDDRAHACVVSWQTLDTFEWNYLRHRPKRGTTNGC